MSLYYDKEGKLLDAHRWAQLCANHQYKTIDRTDVGPKADGLHVSTIWLGLNHAHAGGPPLIFETMVFRGEESIDCVRYSTLADAKRGHARVVKKMTWGEKV